jgi:hypothetical protein
MDRFKVTFIIEADGADPSALLDGAHMAQGDVQSCLEAEGRTGVVLLEEETCVEELV